MIVKLNAIYQTKSVNEQNIQSILDVFDLYSLIEHTINHYIRGVTK